MHGVVVSKEMFWRIARDEVTYLAEPMDVPSAYRVQKKTDTYIQFGYGKKHVRKWNMLGVGEVIYLKESMTLHKPPTPEGKYRPSMDFRLLYRNNYTDKTAEKFDWIPPGKMRVEYARVFLLIVETRLKHIQQLSVADAFCLGYSNPRHFIQEWNHRHPKHSFGTNPWVWLVRFRVSRLSGISNARNRIMKEFYNEINHSK